MNELNIFKNEEFGEIRTVQLNNETYFVGKDVATALGYANPKNAVPTHVSEEDKLSTQIEYAGQRREVTVINESGLYALIFGSKLESAKRFKLWVTSEVLPSIRKHGVYAVDELLDNPDMAIKAFTALKEEREKNKILQADNERMKPKEIFADAVSTSHTAILIGDLAKILKQNGVETGQGGEKRVSIILLSIAVVLTAINQISLILKLKRLCKEQLILQQQLQRLMKQKD